MASVDGCGCPGPERLGHFLFDCALIGCTQLLRGFDISKQPPMPVFCQRIAASKGVAPVEDWPVHLAVSQSPHPGLPQVLGSIFNEARGGLLAFSPCFGDLHTYLRRHGPLPEAVARPLLAQLASAVAHCHSLGVALRDMKLGKVMFRSRERRSVVIADLSAAQMVAPGTMVDDKRGSPAYVAPEVLTQSEHDPYAADMWSLGVIFYAILTGTYPFQDHRPAVLFELITRGDICYPARLSADARRLLAQMLCVAPSQRVTSAQLVEDAYLQQEAGASSYGLVSEETADQVVPTAPAKGTCACPVCHKPFRAAALLSRHYHEAHSVGE